MIDNHNNNYHTHTHNEIIQPRPQLQELSLDPWCWLEHRWDSKASWPPWVSRRQLLWYPKTWGEKSKIPWLIIIYHDFPTVFPLNCILCVRGCPFAEPVKISVFFWRHGGKAAGTGKTITDSPQIQAEPQSWPGTSWNHKSWSKLQACWWQRCWCWPGVGSKENATSCLESLVWGNMYIYDIYIYIYMIYIYNIHISADSSKYALLYAFRYPLKTHEHTLIYIYRCTSTYTHTH